MHKCDIEVKIMKLSEDSYETSYESCAALRKQFLLSRATQNLLFTSGN